MILPRVHLNGTPRAILLEDYERLYSSIYEAVKVFDAIEFNSRDYPSPDDWERAMHARVEAREHLTDALMYAYKHVNSLSDFPIV